MGDRMNEVHLSGRISAVDEERELPSGDTLRAFRLVVRRPPRPGGKVAIDTIDCVCWTGRTRKAVARLGPGDEVELDGALRRRFFRAGGAVASRYEVEVTAVRRVRSTEASVPS